MATVEETAAELERMTDADLFRLEQFSRLRALGFAWLDWRDVLHEAIDRVLSGSRRWPRSVPFIAFMCGVIRSVGNEHWRSRSSRPEVSVSELAQRDDGSTLADQVADDAPDAERQAIAHELLKRVTDVFEADHVSLAILRGLAEGMTPEEIQKQGGITVRQYASGQKRIRRTLARALKEGLV